VAAFHRAPSDYPSGKKGDVLTVEFTIAGVPCLGLNGGPAFKHKKAFSFRSPPTIARTDATGTPSSAMAAKRWSLGAKTSGRHSWQITPRVLTEALAGAAMKQRRLKR
jgi:predicted 3-demethylubiquinone-9 3-methyltransferase (glyoxalase superfamily)